MNPLLSILIEAGRGFIQKMEENFVRVKSMTYKKVMIEKSRKATAYDYNL